MIESGCAVSEVAQSLGIGTNLIYYWTRQAKKKVRTVSGQSNDAFDEEKAALQKRIAKKEFEDFGYR